MGLLIHRLRHSTRVNSSRKQSEAIVQDSKSAGRGKKKMKRKSIDAQNAIYDENMVYEFVKALNSKISNSSQNNTITDLKKFIDDYKTNKLVA